MMVQGGGSALMKPRNRTMTEQVTEPEITRDDWARILRWDGDLVYEDKIDAAWEKYQITMTRQKAFQDAGVKISYRKHLLKMTNIKVWGGRLQDGTLHYQWQITVEGDTYKFRDALKAAGFRWDAAGKLWQRPMSMQGKSIHDHLEQAKDEFLAILGK